MNPVRWWPRDLPRPSPVPNNQTAADSLVLLLAAGGENTNIWRHHATAATDSSLHQQKGQKLEKHDQGITSNSYLCCSKSVCGGGQEYSNKVHIWTWSCDRPRWVCVLWYWFVFWHLTFTGKSENLVCKVENGKEYPILWTKKTGEDTHPLSYGKNLVVKNTAKYNLR